MRRPALLLALVLCSSGCEAVRLWSADPLQDQASVQPNERPLRSVPAGAVPTDLAGGGLRVQATLEPARSASEAASLENPVASGPEALAAGKIGYGRYCSHCHGELGFGWTSVGSSLDPPPPDLVEVTEGRGDGELFGIVTFGNGRLSPALGPTIEVGDRWLIIHYLRTLPAARQGQPARWEQPALAP